MEESEIEVEGSSEFKENDYLSYYSDRNDEHTAVDGDASTLPLYLTNLSYMLLMQNTLIFLHICKIH